MADTESLTWRNTTAALGALKPWAHNPRYSTKAQAKRLLASWKDLGQFQTIAIGPGGEVYDGHQRLSALLTVYGPEYTVDCRQSSRALTDAERQKLVITAHVGAVGSWDWDKLAAWDTAQVGEWGMDAEALKAWNSDAAQLSQMLGAEQAEQIAPEFKEYDESVADGVSVCECLTCGHKHARKD